MTPGFPTTAPVYDNPGIQWMARSTELTVDTARSMQGVDKFAFVIGLAKIHRDPQLYRFGTTEVLYVSQGRRPINFGLARAKQVQVRAIKDQY